MYKSTAFENIDGILEHGGRLKGYNGYDIKLIAILKRWHGYLEYFFDLGF